MGYGYGGDDDEEEDQGESTLVFEDGALPMEPVDRLDQLPSPPMEGYPEAKVRAYVREQNAFYMWTGTEWERRD